MDRKRFERLVHRALEELPAQFQTKLENVVVLVEDFPPEELLESMDIPPEDTLFGLYEGVPLTERGHEAPLYPDRILIFQQPIEEECDGDEERIVEEIKITVAHEIAHFFGLDDDYLHDIGY